MANGQEIRFTRAPRNIRPVTTLDNTNEALRGGKTMMKYTVNIQKASADFMQNDSMRTDTVE